MRQVTEPWFTLDGPGSIGPAVKRRSPFSLRRSLAKYIGVAGVMSGAWFANMNAFPWAHAEAGDRSEIERVMVGTFPLNIGQPTIITRDFPVGDPWLAMVINLRGELLGGGAPTGTVKADAPLQLWQLALTTDLDRDVIEPSISARAMFRHSHFMSGTPGELVAPTIPGAAATTLFNAGVTIPFVDNRLLVPEDSILDTRRYNTITLTVTTGALTDIVTTPVQITLQNVVADVALLRVSPRVPLPLDVVKVLPFYKRYAPIVPPADTFVNLDRIPTLAIKRQFMFASAGTDVVAGVGFTGAGSDAVIDTIRISSNRRDHFGSAQGGVSRRVLRTANKEDYSIETWPTGWYVADVVLDKSLLSALATGDLSVLQTLFLYQGGLPATPQVTILQSGVQKLRGTEGR